MKKWIILVVVLWLVAACMWIVPDTKIGKNIKWAIFNNPPISIIETPAKTPCDYCGEIGNVWIYGSTVVICADCRKKVYDKVIGVEKSSSMETVFDITQNEYWIYDREVTKEEYNRFQERR